MSDNRTADGRIIFALAAKDVGKVVVQGAHWRVVDTPWKDCYVVLNDTVPHRSAIYYSRERAVERWAREEGQ